MATRSSNNLSKWPASSSLSTTLPSSSSPSHPIFAPCILALQLMAIYALCLFHIWPSVFGNGFLAVDIMFIISGFLTTSHLLCESAAKEKATIFSKLVQFYPIYIRQVMVPAILAICLTLIGGFSLFLEKELNTLFDDTLWALSFAINHGLIEVDWTMELMGLPNQRPLIHFWAISVLLQFVLAFSIPFSLAFHLLNEKNLLPAFLIYPVTALLALPSFLLWLLAPSRSVAFGWMFARAWQFLAGALAFLAYKRVGWRRKNDGSREMAQTDEQVPFAALPLSWPLFLDHFLFYSVAIALGLLLFLPSLFWPSFFHQKIALSILLCFLTTFLLYFYPSRLKKHMKPLASSQILAQHLGQFPIILYLLHRPIIEFLKYYLGISLLTIKYGFLALALITIFSLVLHFFLSKWLESAKFSTIGLIFVAGYTFAILCTFAPNAIQIGQNRAKVASTLPIFNNSLGRVQFAPFDVNSSLILLEQLQTREYRPKLLPFLEDGQKVRLNEMLKSTFTFDPLIRMPGHQSEEFVEENQLKVYNSGHLNRIFEWKIEGNGTKSILVFGNSHAQVVWRELEQTFAGNYAKFHVITVPACMPIFERDWRTFYGISCAQINGALMNLLQKHRPHILILVFKWYEELAQNAVDGQIEEDETFRKMQSFLSLSANLVKERIFFPAPNLQFDYEIAHQLAKRIWQNASIEGMGKKYEAHLIENKWNYARLNALECGRCTFFDMADAFCERGEEEGEGGDNDRICHPFDAASQLAYFADTNHLSFYGRLKAKPFFAKLLN